MSAIDSSHVTIIGAGTMGAGIAQVAAAAGWTVSLKDVDAAVCNRAIGGIRKRLDRLVEKERMTPDERDAAASRLSMATADGDFARCGLVIEAIIEDLDVKSKVLREIIPALSDECIIATNTSSLSVSELGRRIGEPRRTVGMHFFNPAPLMKLVEVIAGDETDSAVVDLVAEIAQSWGKQVARAADVPGFIVNHVARPYYLEAFRILEDGYATPEAIDGTMKTLGGFRMGPLELTDLIGQDVNAATTRSVWQQLDRPPLLRPSDMQERLVADGRLGRKSGRGVYLYPSETPTSDIEIRHAPPVTNDGVREAASGFVSRATDQTGDDAQQYIFARILIAIIAQAALAHQRGVATPADIDTALKYGVNYPQGPFEWADRIGRDACVTLLDELNRTVDDDRFAVPASLRSS
jgi:3-hydroxybutyryl-CoA dehydrogenase